MIRADQYSDVALTRWLTHYAPTAYQQSLHGSAMTKLKRSRTQLERVALRPQIMQILDEFRI